MSRLSLEQKIQAHGDVFKMLYNAPGGPFPFPIKSEFSNWQDEQRAWSNAAVLQNMSHHMTEHTFRGPDIYKLLSDLGINSLAGFGPMQAKQYVVCNFDGYYIGDAILFCETNNEVTIVGKPATGNWVAFHAETGGYKVELAHVDRPSPNLSDRRHFRFQVQGPNADRILEELNGGSLPDIEFFKMGKFSVGPHQVTALNHRMSGAPGYEIWGPSADGQAVMDLLIETGTRYGMQQIGGRIYPVTATVSGWVSSAISAVYTGEKMKPYREWLPAQGYEGNSSIGGSNNTGRIEDHYLTPYEMGYGFIIRFDHDFIGRKALERMKSEPKRRKARLLWNPADVVGIYASLMNGSDHGKLMEMPVANYSTAPQDKVMLGKKQAGVSFCPIYSVQAGGWISLAAIDEDLATDGRELTLIWGEPDGGSDKATVEAHVQTSVRVVVDCKPKKRAMASS